MARRQHRLQSKAADLDDRRRPRAAGRRTAASRRPPRSREPSSPRRASRGRPGCDPSGRGSRAPPGRSAPSRGRAGGRARWRRRAAPRRRSACTAARTRCCPSARRRPCGSRLARPASAACSPWPAGYAGISCRRARRPRDPALVENDDAVGPIEHGRTVRDDEERGRRRARVGSVGQSLPERTFGLDVEGRRQVVDDEQLGLANERSCRERTLQLTAGQSHTARADDRFESIGHRRRRRRRVAPVAMTRSRSTSLASQPRSRFSRSGALHSRGTCAA